MDAPTTETPAPSVFDEQRAMARDQIAAAWQLQVEQIQDQLEKGWREQIDRVVEERFATMAGLLESESTRRVDERVAEESARHAVEIDRARGHARREMSERLNQSARRLEQAENAEAWVSALLDGAHAFAPRAILFSIFSGLVRYEGHRSSEGLPVGDLTGFEAPLPETPAFSSVIETLDTVIALRAAGELSHRVAQAVGESPERRVCLLPVLVGRGDTQRRVAAVLLAEGDGEPLDVNILETLCTIAGTVQDCRLMTARLTTAAKPGTLMAIAPVAAPAPSLGPGAPPPNEPDWSQLTKEDQEVHLRAQRFARVRVAEMRLYMSQQVKEGRAQKRLYQALRGEMDRGRAQFKHEFMHSPTMVDYFHQELVRTLANDDPSLLGNDYPGALV
jgi:hypothetical protein